MDDFFNLKELHSKRTRHTIAWVSLGVLLFVVIVSGSSYLLIHHKSKAQQAVLLASPSAASTTEHSGTSQSTPSQTAQSTDSQTSTVNTSELSQEEAQDEAAAAQDEANAQQDLKDAEDGQSSLNDENLPGSTSVLTAPTTAPNAWTSTTGVLSGTYYYAVTFVSSNGTETSLGPVSLSVRPTNQQVWITNIPTSPNSSVIERKIYRTLANGSLVGPFYLVTTINDNSTTSYFDNTPDSSLPTYNPKYP